MGLDDRGKEFSVTRGKKFKRRVRELANTLGISYQAAHQLQPRKVYRVRLIVTDPDDDDRVTEQKTANLSSFSKTGEFIRLADGRRFQVWHPLLMARVSHEETDDKSLPALCVYKTLDEGQVSAVEVTTPGVRVPPVVMDLRSEVCPLGVKRHVTRPYMEGDGIDIEIGEQLGSSMFGHHVYSGQSGLYLKHETLDVRYNPYRLRLPRRDK